MCGLLLLGCVARTVAAPATPEWKAQHDRIVARLRALAGKESQFGTAYEPLFRAALPWYELWGGRNPDPVDPGMVSPEAFATDLAQSLEQGRNYFAEHPSALFPLVFQKTLPDGRTVGANYWLTIPAGFPSAGKKFPLVVGLHGSGWLAHKISFKQVTSPQGPVFSVTPIDMDGPWHIDFLNAFLDELESILPIDQDRIYVQGHSLGGMATWEWALDNPERFAAISPMAGIGEPYRACRLKHVPAWVIHGGRDDVVPSGFADQMVTALEGEGAPVRYSIIEGGEHNMPRDFDSAQVLAWYLKQTRSHLPVPADPRDSLGLGPEGFSPCNEITREAGPAWKSESFDALDLTRFRDVSKPLFAKVHERGELADSPLREELDASTHRATLWLELPRLLHHEAAADPSVVLLPKSRYYRFYFRGETLKALSHIDALRAALATSGRAPTGKVWITSLSIWRETPGAIAEYWIETTPLPHG